MLGFSAVADAPIGDAREDQYLALTSQTLTLIESSIGIVTASDVNLLLAAQALITTLNSPTIQAAAQYALNSQNLTTTLHTVSASAAASATPTSVTASTELKSVALSTSNTLNVIGVTSTAFISPILWSTDTVLEVSGFSITSDVNSFRQFWVDVFTIQIPDIPYDNTSIASMPVCYTPPEPTTNPSVQGTWNAITPAATSLWTDVTTTQDSNWVNIPT